MLGELQQQRRVLHLDKGGDLVELRLRGRQLLLGAVVAEGDVALHRLFRGAAERDAKQLHELVLRGVGRWRKMEEDGRRGGLEI